jgi:TRAP-type C4-dicarboxylate transport system permease small subunit
MLLTEEAKIVGDDGEFHIEDEAVRLAGTTPEAWAALVLFWALAATVFYQFVTRYVMNDSAAWTEEIARYLLIGVVFVGAAVGVGRNNHIQVDLLYRYLPARASRAISTLVDVLRIVLLAAFAGLTLQMMLRMGNYKMTVVDLPMNIVYGVCLAGFVAMLYRAVRLALVHWRRGWSVLERPEFGETAV